MRERRDERASVHCTRPSVNKFGNILSIRFSDQLTQAYSQMMVKVSGGFSSLTHPKNTAYKHVHVYIK